MKHALVFNVIDVA